MNCKYQFVTLGELLDCWAEKHGYESATPMRGSEEDVVEVELCK